MMKNDTCEIAAALAAVTPRLAQMRRDSWQHGTTPIVRHDALLVTVADKDSCLDHFEHRMVGTSSDGIVMRADADRGAAIRFDLGVALHWCALWHHDYRLWVGDEGAAWMVSDTTDAPTFRITDGRLDAFKTGPASDATALQAGYARAERLLQPLTEVC